MGKRITLILLILLLTVLAVTGYFFLQGRKNLYSDPYTAISPGAAVVFESVDLQSFINSITTQSGLFGEIGKIKDFDPFNTKLKYFADQLNKEEYRKLVIDSPVIISLQKTTTGKLKPLLSVAVPGEISYRYIKEILRSTGIKEIGESNKNGNKAITIPFVISNKKDTAYISLVSGLLLFSSSSELMSDAIVQMSSGIDVRSQPGFSRVLHASGKHEDKIFIVFANLSPLFGNILTQEGQELAEKVTKLAGTAEGDIYINEDGLVLSGYTETFDSTDFLYRYKFIPPGEFNTYKILPASTVLFETLVLPDQSQRNKPGGDVSRELIDLADKLKVFIGEEITRAFLNIRDNPAGDNALIIYRLSNRVQAEQIFLEEAGSDKEVLNFKPDDQITIPVYKTRLKGLSGVLLPGFAPEFDDIYYVFYDNYLVSGSSFITISNLLYDNLLNKTLANDLKYREFASTLPSRAGYFFYCIPSLITNYLADYLDNDIIEGLISNKTSLDKIQAAGYQAASSNGMIYNSLSVVFKDEVREEAITQWETLLDTTACIKPYFFTNHNTGAKEIFIQDMKNNVYLINAAGRVLWKVPLKERITGTIYTIDFYKNGKYQLLFSGRNNIHLLDRNGNYVERYPVKLRSPATNSMALFDYDNNLNYRLFIAGEDKLIYSYDKTGNVVKGWKPFRTTSKVRAEVNYFRVSGKDYIVVADEVSLFFLDRTGKRRVKLKAPVTKAVGSAMRLIGGSEPSVVCSSPDGSVQQVYFDGSVKKFSLKKFSIDHTFDFFDVDSDGFGEYIFIDNGILYLYDNDKSEMFMREFGSTDLGGPINFIFSASNKQIGVFDVNNKLIYLIDKNGNIMNGFPLRGESMFSIGKLSDKSGWHLIVGGTDRFLYNYKIETGKNN